MSQSEVPAEEEQQPELRNERGETLSQQGRRVLRELDVDVAEEVNDEEAPEVARDDLTFAQLRRAAQGNPEPRNGTGGQFPFKCFGPGCGRRFISKNSLCHHFYIECSLCEPQSDQVGAYKAQGLSQCDKCEMWFSSKVSKKHNCDGSGLDRVDKAAQRAARRSTLRLNPAVRNNPNPNANPTATRARARSNEIPNNYRGTIAAEAAAPRRRQGRLG